MDYSHLNRMGKNRNFAYSESWNHLIGKLQHVYTVIHPGRTIFRKCYPTSKDGKRATLSHMLISQNTT